MILSRLVENWLNLIFQEGLCELSHRGRIGMRDSPYERDDMGLHVGDYRMAGPPATKISTYHGCFDRSCWVRAFTAYESKIDLHPIVSVR